MPHPTITLHPGRETSAAFRHPWIFSGAIARRAPDARHGGLVRVESSDGRLLGTGTYSSRSSIAVRLLDPGEADINDAWFAAKFREADSRRRLLGYGPGTGTGTTAYRVIFGEADGVPGLVVDRYGEAIVFQISTAGLDSLRDDIIASLKETFEPSAIIERSDVASRAEEGLGEVSGLIDGELAGPALFLEDGLQFSADLLGGQKTGFFLDQKDLRRTVRSLARGRRGLNVFSYTGATSIAAMAGGAASMHNVDASQSALEGARRHAEMHGIAADAFTGEAVDAFQFFGDKKDPAYDLVVIDPPALIKSAKDTEEGRRAYHFLNRAAMRLTESGGIFVTSSCSHYLTEDDMAFILRRASLQAGVTLDILAVIRQSPDHPQSIYFPESSYLKSFVCLVKR